ncbi:MAG: pyridoxal-phosphate dependent enzyme [Oligoflexales bacterium]|nr:pyridoxal-phosphate dependent enzyme [Oligoflexales bacterium]
MRPTLEEIKRHRDQIRGYCLNTPTFRSAYPLNAGDKLPWFKGELFQYSGSFKYRSVISFLSSLSNVEKATGVCAASGGNHAIAVGLACQTMDIPATVVVPKTINAGRLELLKSTGVSIIFADDIASVFSKLDEVKQQGLLEIPAFSGPHILRGIGTLALEIYESVPDLEAVVASVGGGGLLSGLAYTLKAIGPNIAVYGVEPEGAPTISNSLKNGKPQKLEKIDTIADSLSAPYALDYSFQVISDYVDEIGIVSDEQIRSSMRWALSHLNLKLEPACAAAIAACQHPLREKLGEKNLCVVLCGTNIDLQSYQKLLENGL